MGNLHDINMGINLNSSLNKKFLILSTRQIRNYNTSYIDSVLWLVESVSYDVCYLYCNAKQTRKDEPVATNELAHGNQWASPWNWSERANAVVTTWINSCYRSVTEVQLISEYCQVNESHVLVWFRPLNKSCRIYVWGVIQTNIDCFHSWYSKTSLPRWSLRK